MLSDYKVDDYVVYFNKIYKVLKIYSDHITVQVEPSDCHDRRYEGYVGSIYTDEKVHLRDARKATAAEVVTCILKGTNEIETN